MAPSLLLKEWNANLRLCTSWGDRGPHGRIEDRSISDVKNMGFPSLGHEQTYSQVRAMSALPAITGLAQCTPRVVLDAGDLAVDRVGLHVRPLSCDGLLIQVSQS